MMPDVPQARGPFPKIFQQKLALRYQTVALVKSDCGGDLPPKIKREQTVIQMLAPTCHFPFLPL